METKRIRALVGGIADIAAAGLSGDNEKKREALEGILAVAEYTKAELESGRVVALNTQAGPSNENR